MKDKTTIYYTEELANFVVDLEYKQIPNEVISYAKLCLLDAIGCALYGANSKEARIVAEVVQDWSTKPESRIWGSGNKTACSNAALINGTMIDSFTLADSHREANIHVSAVVVPTAFSVAERIGNISGKHLITAIIAGYESAIHVGMAMCPDLQLRGYHPVGSVGGFGAAATAGKLFGFDSSRMTNAFGIVGSQGGGLMAGQYDSMVKRMHAGKAAQNGVFSTLLAAEGFKGITNVLEAEYGGFCSTLTDNCDLTKITAGLGHDFETLNIYFRRYCCSGAIITAVDTIKKLSQQNVFDVSKIAKVIVGVSEVTLRHNGWKYNPGSAITAQSNMAYGVSVALLEGDAFIDQFQENKLSDPDILELIEKIEVVSDEEITKKGAHGKHSVKIEIYLKNSQCLKMELSKPLSVEQDDILKKFELLVNKTLYADKTEKIQELVLNLEMVENIQDVVTSICT